RHKRVINQAWSAPDCLGMRPSTSRSCSSSPRARPGRSTRSRSDSCAGARTSYTRPMCFDADARPPLPPIRGAALDSRDLTLTAADGTRVAAHAARAAEPTGAGMVILPDVRGLHPFFDELALHFAEARVDAITFDYFSRTAGTGKRDDAFDYQSHVPQMRHETIN